MNNFKINFFLLALVLCLTKVSSLGAYPLDGTESTGIKRLEGYKLSLLTKSGKEILVPGARGELNDVKLNIKGEFIFIPPADKDFTNRILSTVPASYKKGLSVAVYDLTDLSKPRYAEHNGLKRFIPASVGKIVSAIGVLGQLKDLYPNDIKKRIGILKDTIIQADQFSVKDTHEVPFWDNKSRDIYHRPIQVGDKANLWTYLDWMLSASSNAAGSMIAKQGMLLNRYRKSYPVPVGEADEWIQRASSSELVRTHVSGLRKSVRLAGLNPNFFWQGGYFTRGAKKIVPSAGSTATVRELIYAMLLMEEGKLIDEFSSLELKRLLYHTQKRVRFASSPKLENSRLYFKSGSMYSCYPEAGYSCEKFKGNAKNLMNAVAVVEDDSVTPNLFYIVAVSSNILKIDSAKFHSELGGAIHQVILDRHSSKH